ncbi:MAG: hypothetical protein K6G26_05820 [Lachnospiraceae bacterium]|nr:hypothetical protein [Lachnospiraceae bacterium]
MSNFLAKKTNDNTAQVIIESREKSMLLWGYSFKLMIISVWSLPWIIILGYTLGFSSFFWGIAEFYSAVLLTFILLNKDFGFLPITYFIVAIYFIFQLPEMSVQNTRLGYYWIIAWCAINILFGLFITVNTPLRNYKRIRKNINKYCLSDNFKKDVRVRLLWETGTLIVIAFLMLLSAYFFSRPKNFEDSYKVTFRNADFEKAVRKELGLKKDAEITCKDLDKIQAISINSSENIKLGSAYKYDTSSWSNEDTMLNFPDLIRFDGNNYTLKKGITDINDLQYFRNLRFLSITGDDSLILYHLEYLRGLKKLETLSVTTSKLRDYGETNLEAISYLKSLKCLTIVGDNISDIDYIKKLNKLNTFRFANNRSLHNKKSYSCLKNVEYIALTGCKIKDLSALKDLKKVKYLSLYDNKARDLSGLSQLSTLTCLDLRKNDISDVLPLKDITNLEYLALLDNNPLSNVNELTTLPSLKRLWIENSDAYDLSAFREDIEIYTK